VELEAGLRAARAAVEAVAALPHVITPFPGGVARSGSKVGSRYKLVASTADEFCPTLRGRVNSRLHAAANVALEIVINGTSAEHVKQAMGVAIRAAAGPDVVAISAGNYGGKLGKHCFHLHQLVTGPE
jgi:formylmethanofuran--tetrahydromethanopterin N-formyltransferase